MLSVAKTSFGQNQKKMDSLQTLLNAAKEDTARLRICVALGMECENKDNLKYWQPVVDLADKMLSKITDDKQRKFVSKQKAVAVNNLAETYRNMGNYPKALECCQNALAIAKQLDNKTNIAELLMQIGGIYKDQGDTAQALENCKKALSISNEIKDTNNLASALLSIGEIYSSNNMVKALTYYNKAILLYKDNKDKGFLSFMYFMIGRAYVNTDKPDYNMALKYLEKDLSMYQDINEFNGIEGALRLIGTVYARIGEINKAIDYHTRALEISEKNSRKDLIGRNCIELAKDYLLKRIYKKAKYYSELSIAAYKNIDIANETLPAEKTAAKVDSACGNYKEAYEHYKQYIILRDKLNSDEVKRAAINEKYKEEADKQKAEQEKKDAIAVAENRKQKVLTGSVIAGLLLVLVFAVFVLRSLNVTRKQKQIIEQKSKETELQKLEVERQKHIIEEKQHEIIDSITYAKRLQQAILPSLNAVKEQLPNSFVYYKPKDIVAGDFYWMHTARYENRDISIESSAISNLTSQYSNLTFIAAADCTGHGVPGAMVSVVCSNALNRAVNEFNLTDTGLILDKTRELVIETFEKSDAEVKDGMDISLLRIQKSEFGIQNFQWSGANNSLWYVLNNELIEVKADKQPIGKYSEAKPFTTNNFTFNASVTFYLFSDGYADQFSPDDKKLMKKKFKDIVLSIQNLPMAEQKNYLEKYHNDWKANMEQTDDVLVIGLKV